MDSSNVLKVARVSVFDSDRLVDLALPTGLQVRDLIPRIRTMLAGGGDDDPVLADEQTVFRPYSLCRIGGTPFSVEATLGALGVTDGELLALVMLPPGPTAPPVVEDLADAAAIHAAEQSSEFRHALLAPMAQVYALLVSALVVGVSVFAWHSGFHHWAAGALGVVTLVAVLAAVVLARRGQSAIAGHVALATVVPLGLASGLALSGDAAAPRVFLGAALVTAWSMALAFLGRQWTAVHAAIFATAGAVAAAAACRTLWHLQYAPLGCGLIGVALIVSSAAPTWSTMAARYPLPNVPAPGEPTPSPPPLAELEELPRRVALTQSFQSGLLAAAVLMTVIGSVLVVWPPARPGWWNWGLVVAIALVMVLRMRSYDVAAGCLWLLSTPLLSAASVSVVFLATGHVMAGVYGMGVLIGLLGVFVAVAANAPGALSIPGRGQLDKFESVLLWSVPVAMLVLSGVLTLIQEHGVVR